MGWSGVVTGRSLQKLETLANLRGCNPCSDFALAFELDRSSIRGSGVGVRTFVNLESTKAVPRGLSPVIDSSLPSPLTRRRRSEDRIVTVEGTLLNILFVGVSNPQAALALTKLFSPFRIRTGVILPLLAVLFVVIPFRGVARLVAVCPPLSRRLAPDAGVPTITQFTTNAEVVTRTSAPDGLRPRSPSITGLALD